MTFDDLNKKMEDAFGSMKLSDIARELNVTPQVVSNWKARNQVPYRYVKAIRKKIEKNRQKDPQKVTDNFQNFNYDFNKDNNDAISFKNVISMTYGILMNNKSTILGIPVLAAILSYLYFSYFADPIYVSSAKILPTAKKNQISGLASQFGLNLGSSGDMGISSAHLYPEILRSRRLSKALLNRNVDIYQNDSIAEFKLIDYLVPFNEDWAEVKNSFEKRILRGLKLLRDEILVVTFSRKTSLVDLSVQINDSKLSEKIASFILEELDNIQNNIKLNKINEKKDFIEKKIKDLDIDLKNAEEKLKNFRESNRSIQSSPALLLIEERMIRDISILTQIYIGLKNEYEQTLIEKVENRKMFIVLEYPEIPLSRSGPNSRKMSILVYIFFTMSTFSFLLLKDWYKKNFDSFKKEVLRY